MENNERWLIDGDCSKCRRDKYCSKPCTLVKRQSRFLLSKTVHDTLNQATGGMLDKVNNIYSK